MRVDQDRNKVEIEHGESITLEMPDGLQYIIKEGKGPGFQIFRAAESMYLKLITHQGENRCDTYHQDFVDVIIVDGEGIGREDHDR